MTATAQSFKVNVRNKNIKKSKTVEIEIELEVGQKIRYGFYSNITFEGFDEKDQAILKDKSGNLQHVARWLFEKYVEVEI